MNEDIKSEQMAGKEPSSGNGDAEQHDASEARAKRQSKASRGDAATGVSRAEESERTEGAGGAPEREGSEETHEQAIAEVVSETLEAEETVPKAAYDELYDKYLRLLADFDNYKKRVLREKADIIAYGNEEIIKELLAVVDNLERALQHSDLEDKDSPLLEGIKLVHRQFLASLEKFGAKPIETKVGDVFDPRIHQAIEQVESSDLTPGLVLSEVIKGYMLKDKLLRPALVAVSKAPEARETKAGS
jgi:molecular chaperone GrpE